MLMQRQMRCSLWSVPQIGTDGTEKSALLGEIRAALVYRSSEESEENDVLRASETVYAVIADRFSPPGGFRRGMWLTHGDVRYRMLNPVRQGRFWSVKCGRVHL